MAKDTYHEAVKRALEKDGWKITDDPLYFSAGEVDFEIDLGAPSECWARNEAAKKLQLK